MKKWSYVCPICNQNVVEDYTEDEVKDYIGATHDCPKCNGLLRINEDLSCSDFGEELVERYKEMGLDITKDDATHSYIEV